MKNPNTSPPNIGQFFEDEKPIDIAEIIKGYLRYWKWFVLSVVTTLILAIIYLKLNKPVYQAVASVIIEDEKAKATSGEVGTFVDLGMMEGLRTSSIENEIGLIGSKRLMTNAVKALGLNVLYHDNGNFLGIKTGFSRRELYKQTPYKIRLLRLNEEKLKNTIKLEQHVLEIGELDAGGIAIEQAENGYRGAHKLGDVVALDFVEFIVEANATVDTLMTDEEAIEPKSVEVTFLPADAVATALRSQVTVELVDENSTLIQLSIENKVTQKAKDILDQLVFEYNQEAIEDKNLIARNTAYFIDERLSIINSELDSVETGKEQFKTANNLTDIATESSVIIQNVSDYNNRQQEVTTELEVTNAMIENLNANQLNLLPANMALSETGLTLLVDEYNKLVLERNRLLEDATETNPMVVDILNQLREIRENIRKSLLAKRSSLLITQDNLRRQAGILGSQISERPSQEREFRGIERQQNIKEALYLFLLQKREENSLSLAAKAPKAKIVDRAYTLEDPVSPNKKLIIGLGFLAGIFVPFMIINVNRLLDNKINTREDLKNHSEDLAILGEIPHILENESTVVSIHERSVFSESFNILGANLDYVMPNGVSKVKGKSIFVTSSNQGEGKTFTTINLAMTLAESGNSVVMVGADLRNPQLHRHEENGMSREGLTDYLTFTHKEIFDYLKNSSLHPNLKILPSGPIPPNPVQLLRKDLVGQMLDELKAFFDYVIVDTPPAMILADTFLISKYADLTLYLVRAGKTPIKAMNFVNEVHAEGKLKNLTIVLNDVEVSGTTYGYRYGDDAQKKKRADKVFKKIRNWDISAIFNTIKGGFQKVGSHPITRKIISSIKKIDFKSIINRFKSMFKKSKSRNG